MKMRLPISLKGRRLLAVAALMVVVSVGAVVAIMVVLSEPAESQPGSPVAHPELVTPLPFTGYPPTVHPPDTANPPRCQAPQDERPAPDLPPLPCRNSGNEPAAGAIPTPGPADALSPQNAPAGWQVVDNPLFRYTLAIPPGWYANIRREGGEFYVLDPVALDEDAKGVDPPGGVVMHFTAWGPPAAKISATPVPFDPQAYAPNAASASYAGYPGATWEEDLEGAEGLARTLSTVFVRDGVTFQAAANFGVGLSDAEVATEVELVRQILTTITPY
jgi:hypothetical protein